mgnify:CR=1 FL=1
MSDITNDIIEKIIDIEKRANDIVSIADEKKKSFNYEVEQEIKKIDDEYMAKANAKVKQIAQLETSHASESEAKSQQYLNEKKAELKQFYDKNKQVWLENLFEQIIK